MDAANGVAADILQFGHFLILVGFLAFRQVFVCPIALDSGFGEDYLFAGLINRPTNLHINIQSKNPTAN